MECVVKRFGVLDTTSCVPGLNGFAEWSQKTLTDLSKRSESFCMFRYAVTSTKVSKMISLKEVEKFAKEMDDPLHVEIVACAAVDNIFLEVDTEAYKKEKELSLTDTTCHLVFEVLNRLRVPACFSLTKRPSVYSLRCYSRLLSVCPCDGKNGQKDEQSTIHAFRRILGADVLKQIRRKKNYSSSTEAIRGKHIEEFLQEQLGKSARTGHLLGEPDIYIKFMLLAQTFFRTRSYERLINITKQWKGNDPDLFKTPVFDELVAQFLWKRGRVHLRQKECYEYAWDYNVEALAMFPKNDTLIRLLIDNGYRRFNVLRQLVSTDTDPTVRTIRACAKMYAIALWNKRENVDISEDPLTRRMIENLILDAMKSGTCATLVRVWLRYKKHLLHKPSVSIEEFRNHTRMFPLNKFLLFDYMKLGGRFVDPALLRIFGEMGLHIFVDPRDAQTMKPDCTLNTRNLWKWEAPFCDNILMNVERASHYQEVGA